MDKNRIWIIGSALLMAIVVALGWFLGVAPQLTAAAQAEAQRAGVQALNVQQEATLASLKKDYAKLGAMNAELSDLSASVPSDTDTPAFVDEVDAVAVAAGVTVTGIKVADATPYEPVSPPASAGGAATPPPTSTPTPGATPTPSATPTPKPTPIAGMPPVTSPKLTSANFSSLAVTLTVKGTYAQGLAFVNGIQTGKRLFLVSGITTSAASSGSGTASKPSAGEETITVTGLIFVVTPTSPTAAPTPSK